MLKARFVTAIFLIVGFVAALFFLADLQWAALMLVICVLGAWEWGRLAGFSIVGQRVFSLSTLGVGVLLLPDLWPEKLAATQHYLLFYSVLAAAIFWLVVAPLWLLKHHRETRRFILAAAGMVVLLPAWLALVHLRRVSPMLLLAVMAAVWLADSAAYFSGKNFGRHKLAPLISPGKTWEGVAGAWVAITTYGFALCWMFNLNLWLIVGLWGLMVLSIIGDLFESLLKRQAGFKDSGNILPGHGGVLDRIDGLTSTLPLAVFYIHFPLYYVAFYG